MIEAEFKIRIKDREKVKQKLEDLGFSLSRSVRETDSYFDTPEQRIYNRGEALRVRQILDHDSLKEDSCITFKGKKLDTVSKTRRELETGVRSAQTATEIFEALGYEVVSPQVVKERLYFENGELHACLDRVKDLGDFLEIEMVIAGENELEEAQEKIAGILEKLGYGLNDSVSTSYLGLLQNREF